MLQLFPDKKQACLIDFNDLPDEYSENLLESMRNAIRELQDDPNVSIDRLPDSVVDGRNAVGFHAKSAQDEVTVWADPETLLPIRLEQIQYGLKLNIVCTNFQFDVELDPSLFSMDIPEGYRTASGQWDFGESSEKALLEGLRLWAQVLEDNQFPEDLSGATYLKMPGIKKKLRNGTLKLSRQQGLDMALNVMAPFFQFVTSLKPEQDWHYVGASVPFGDASKPVCWYKPIGSKTYRVVYGDLSVKDLPKEDLPK
jgi:hypothetical protein